MFNKKQRVYGDDYKERKRIKTCKKLLTTMLMSLVAVLSFMILFSQLVSEKINIEKDNLIDPELARAMTYDQFIEGDELIDVTDNVKFSAFFLRDLDGDGYAEKIKGSCIRIGEQDTLYFELKIETEGQLENGKIEIDGKNFYLNTSLPRDNELKDNYVSANTKTIEFETLTSGTQKLIMGKVRSGDYSYTYSKAKAIGSNINNYSRDDNRITFSGTYVDDLGNRTEIYKVIDLATDWYGETNTTLKTFAYYLNQNNYDLPTRIDTENNTLNLSFTVYVDETDDELNLYNNYVTGTIPQANGYSPISVTCSNLTSGFSYTSYNRKFTINRSATTDSNGNIVKSINGHNEYTINVVYSLDALTSVDAQSIALSIPIEATYSGYNNQNEEFTNPFVSEVARDTIIARFENPKQEDAGASIKVGTYATDPYIRYYVKKEKPLRLYNLISAKEEKDRYNVVWNAHTGDAVINGGLILKENGKDVMTKTDGTTFTMDNISRFAGISFTGVSDLLSNDGWLRVFDADTNTLLLELNNKTFDKYTSSSPYYYKQPVKHIRIETSQVNSKARLTVTNIKEIDDMTLVEEYSKEEFDTFKYITSSLNVKFGQSGTATCDHEAVYEESFSQASIKISKDQLSTQVTETATITINAEANSNKNITGWNNAVFLVKMPEEMIDVEITSISSSNNKKKILSYEVLEINGCKFIKVYINSTDTSQESYSINIYTKLTVDPRSLSADKQIELYAINELYPNYYNKRADAYDVDGDGNTEEMVNHSSVTISMMAPNSILTCETLSEFDEEGSIVVSPQIADLIPLSHEEEREKRTVRVGVHLKNNFEGTVSETIIIGKIPFEGNTQAIASSKALGSSFSTTMKSPGITVPEHLQGKVTIYYSEAEKPTTSISTTTNHWKTADNVQNWEDIKSYLIVYGEELLNPGEEDVFYYDVEVPFGVQFNKVSYSHHGVYCSLDTPGGKLRTQLEPNKIGIRIAEKYNIEINKYQKDKEKKVYGATYKITKFDENGNILSSRTAVTNANGQLFLDSLYAEMTYCVQEIKSPDEYELNDDVISFVCHVNRETMELSLEKIYGTTKGEMELVKPEDEDYKLIVNVEDEVKGRMRIYKTDEATSLPMQGVKFVVKGTGMPSGGKVVVTNDAGMAEVVGLKIGAIYTVEETRAAGYYLAKPFKFKMLNNEGEYSIEYTENSQEVDNTDLIYEDDFPIGIFEMDNRKIPTFNLELTKIKYGVDVTAANLNDIGNNNGESVTLAGVPFILYKDGTEIGSYTTDENGKIQINGLYQYESDKKVDQTYVLKEVYAPEGYAKAEDLIFKVEKKDGKLVFTETEKSKKVKDYVSEGDTVRIIYENAPIFKFIKKDSETGEALPNCKFAIYDVDEATVPARDSDGNYIGEKETINGKEYYVVTTDQNGELSINLPEGLYKAVEVQASDEKYDISNAVYYFGVGKSKHGDETRLVSSVSQFRGNYEIRGLTELSDNSYLAVGDFYNRLEIDEEEVLSAGGRDGFIVRYNRLNEIDWVQTVSSTQDVYIYSVSGAENDNYYVAGYFKGDLTIGSNTYNSTNYTGLIIKYNREGNVLWVKTIEGVDSPENLLKSVHSTKDGGCVVSGNYKGEIAFDGNTLIAEEGSDAFLIKYGSDGTYNWHKDLKGPGNAYLPSVIETKDEDILVAGYFSGSSLDVAGATVLDGSSHFDCILIEYDKNGNHKQVKQFGSEDTDVIYSVTEVKEGGYVVSGYFSKSMIIDDVSLIFDNYSTTCGYVAKFSEDFVCEYTYNCGSAGKTPSVSALADGGFVVAASAYAVFGITSGSYIGGFNDCGVAVFDSNGKMIFAQSYTTSGTDYAHVVLGLSDGMFLLAGTVDGNLNTAVGQIKQGEFLARYSKKSNVTTVVSDELSLSNRTCMVTTNDKGTLVGYKSGLEKYNENNELEWRNSGIYVKTIEKAKDGNYYIGGNISSNIRINDTAINRIGRADSILIKMDQDGNVIWHFQAPDNYADGISNPTASLGVNGIAELENGDIALVGNFYGVSMQVDDFEIENAIEGGKTLDGFFIRLDENGYVKYARNISENNRKTFGGIISTSDGGYIAKCTFSGELRVDNAVMIASDTSCAAILKFDEFNRLQWYKDYYSYNGVSVNDILETRNNEIVVTGVFNGYIGYENGSGRLYHSPWHDTAGYVLKYDLFGNLKNATSIESKFNAMELIKTDDYGFVLAGGSNSTQPAYVLGFSTGGYGGVLIKFDEEFKIDWVARNPKDSSIIQLEEINPESYRVLSGSGLSTISISKDVEAQSELIAENKVKEYDITTKVNNKTGVPGGTISGEKTYPYETVKYGEDSTKEIKMIPDTNYEIIGITVNGRNIDFEPNADGTYILPNFTDLKEDKEVVVTFGLSENKITIVKEDSVTGELLPGARFNIEQLEERSEPEDAIENWTEDSVEWILVDDYETDEVENVFGDLTDNGSNSTVYNIIPGSTVDVLGELTPNNENYYFVEQEGELLPTNCSTYRLANGLNKISGYTALSYIPIDLTGYTGTFKLKLEANLHNDATNAYGFAVINKNTDTISSSTSNGRFMYINYKDEGWNEYYATLTGGNQYYLHLGYQKGSTYLDDDYLKIRNIEVYNTERVTQSFAFTDNGNGGYVSTNQWNDGTSSKSYIPLDLTDKEGPYELVINSLARSEDTGYVFLTTSTSSPNTNSSTNRVLYASGLQNAPVTTKYAVEGGQKYYLHILYVKNGGNAGGNDQFTINSVKLYRKSSFFYNFVNNGNGGYVSTNEGRDNTTSTSYVPIDLRDTTGKYTLVVNAQISTQSGDYGYATVNQTIEAPAQTTSAGRFINITSIKEPRDYKVTLDGGYLYYLHFGYKKDATTNTSGEDKFTINDVRLELNSSELYSISGETNDFGKLITQLPFGKYRITEVKAPDGYYMNEEPIIIEFRANGENEFVIKNSKIAKVTVHHYVKGTTTQIAPDELIEGHMGDEYETDAIYDNTQYVLEEIDGLPVLPANKEGTFTHADQEVTYNYVPKKKALVVNHYIEGTITKVPLKNGGEAETEEYFDYENADYITQPLSVEALEKSYELVEMPENYQGKYIENETFVNYYYHKVEREVVLNKISTFDNEPLQNVTFGVSKVDSEVYGDLTQNGKVYEFYNQIPEPTYNDYMGELVANGDYYFVADAEGNLTPTNGIRYQESIGGTTGVPTSEANSYIRIDLTELEGTYKIYLDALFSSETNCDIGYATITQSTEAPKHTATQGQFVYNSGSRAKKEYISGTLYGGNIYYLHLGYHKDSTQDKYDDYVKFSNINLYKVEGEELSFGFDEVDGKYVSNNQGRNSTQANAYIPLDLRDIQGNYEIAVNAEISTSSGDYGYIAITENTTAPSYSNSSCFASITNIREARDYTKTVAGGKLYYLHFGYYKNASANTVGEDKFTINYIKNNGVKLVTDENGQARITLGTGNYVYKELSTISGYVLNGEAYNLVIDNSVTNTEFTIPNDRTKGRIITHYYIEGTEDPVTLADGTDAQDAIIEDFWGKEYNTSECANVSARYRLVETPDNATGEIIEGDIVVTYYYRAIPASVLVRHRLLDRQGNQTDNHLILPNGEESEDITIDGFVLDDYTTGALIPHEKYRVVGVPENATGKMTEQQIVVTYYYELKDTSVTTHYYIEGTSDQVPLIGGGTAQDVVQNGKVDDTYTTAPAENVQTKYILVDENPENKNGIMTVEPIEVTYYYRLKDTSVKVHYYLLDRDGNETTNKVLHSDGSEVEDVIIQGRVDDSYSTVAETDILDKYELAVEPDNKTGTMEEEQVTVIYYYQLKDTSVIVHHYAKDTTTKLTDDITIDGKVDDHYTTIESTDVPIYYQLVSEPDNKSGTMTVDPIEVIYYYDYKNYGYIVNYFDIDTNDPIATAKQVDEIRYNTQINIESEVIPIEGYYYDSSDPEVFIVTTENNILNLYYEKRHDLSYTVNYLEKDTNKVIKDQKVVNNMTFKDKITASDEIENIPGYNFDSIAVNGDFNEQYMYIEVEGNVIDIYYTKRTDLSYTVNYLEEGTNKVIHDPKVKGNMTYQEKVYAEREVITIYGYDYHRADKDELEIDVENNVINLYYTRKDAKVIVHHYEIGTTNKLSDDVTLEGKVYDEYVSEEASDIPSKYVLVETPENARGTYTQDPIEVTYYYIKKKTKVTVHYYQDLEETDGEIIQLSEDTVIEGRVDDDYTTEPTDDVPAKFEYTAAMPDNSEGIMTEEEIVVIYYYTTKESKVTFKYIDEDTLEEIAQQEEQKGKVDELYRTDEKEIEGYTFNRVEGEKEGRIKLEEQEVIFYYKKNTKVTIKYIDIITDKEIDDNLWIHETEPDSEEGEGEQEEAEFKDSTIIIKGVVGDDFDTIVKAFDGYVLIEKPESIPDNMTREEIVLVYKYVHVSEGIIERHINTVTQELLEPETIHKGNEGDDYKIEPKDFAGFSLVEEKLPDNSEGKFTIEVITVTYEYIKDSTVTAKYIDVITREELTEDVVIEGHETDDYDTEEKTFENYRLEKIPDNKAGVMTDEPIEVIYEYRHVSGGVIVNYISIHTNENLLDEYIEEGYEGEEYSVSPANIENYVLVEERHPRNENGTFEIEPIYVNYYYKRKAKVVVSYIDKKTDEPIVFIKEGEEVITTEEEDGFYGDEYGTEEKDIPGYILIQEPNNKEGIMEQDETEVCYYYARKAKVIARYMEKDTELPLSKDEPQEGYDGAEYETEEKDIKFYKLVESKRPKNSSGVMEVKVSEVDGEEEIEDVIYVDYIYVKKEFNLEITKVIKTIAINGEVRSINSPIAKGEIHKKLVGSANVQIIYTITVKNNSELKGSATVIESIPTGMTFDMANNLGWKYNGNNITRETKELEPGQSESFDIILEWSTVEANLGTKVNQVSLDDVENEAEFDESNLMDNQATAEIILTVGTGEDKATMIKVLLIALAPFMVAAVIIAITLSKEKGYKRMR